MLDREEVAEELEPHLAKGERVEAAYELTRGALVLTDRRLISFTRKRRNKVAYRSVPYANIERVRLSEHVMYAHTDEGKLRFDFGEPTTGLAELLEQKL